VQRDTAKPVRQGLFAGFSARARLTAWCVQPDQNEDRRGATSGSRYIAGTLRVSRNQYGYSSIWQLKPWLRTLMRRRGIETWMPPRKTQGWALRYQRIGEPTGGPA
jgi:hypothetical protein